MQSTSNLPLIQKMINCSTDIFCGIFLHGYWWISIFYQRGIICTASRSSTPQNVRYAKLVLGYFARGLGYFTRPIASDILRDSWLKTRRDSTFHASWKRDCTNLKSNVRRLIHRRTDVYRRFEIFRPRGVSRFSMAWVPLESNPEVSELPVELQRVIARTAIEWSCFLFQVMTKVSCLQRSIGQYHYFLGMILDVSSATLFAKKKKKFNRFLRLHKNSMYDIYFYSSSTNWAFQRNGQS